MKPGREALIQKEVSAAWELVRQHPLCSTVSVHTGYRLSVQRRDVYGDSTSNPWVGALAGHRYIPGIYDEGALPANSIDIGYVGGIVIAVRKTAMVLRCPIPPVGDYELPGAAYSVRNGLWLEQQIDVEMKLVKAIVDFARELLMFVRMYCDLSAVWGRGLA